MKKYWIFVIFMGFLVQSIHAQSWTYRYGVKLGASTPYYQLSNIPPTTRAAVKTLGLSVTGLVEASPSPYFALQTGMSFQLLGATLTHSEYGDTKVKQHSFWLQLPVNIMAKLPLQDSSHFFLSAGPYTSLGIMGANSFADTYTGNRKDFSFGAHGTQKRLDYGLNFILGYQLRKGYNIALGYMMGVADLATQSSYKQRNRAWFISVGYSF